MKFVILGWDGPDSQKLRPLHRSAHLRRLEDLEEQGRLICAGPLGNHKGSLIILDVESLQEAEAFAQADPYLTHGIFERVEVHPFTHVLPKSS